MEFEWICEEGDVEIKRFSRLTKISQTPYNYSSLFCSSYRPLEIALVKFMLIVPIFFYREPLSSPDGDTHDSYLSRRFRTLRAPRQEFLVLSRYWKRPEYESAIKFFVIEFILARFIADASDSLAYLFLRRLRGCIFQRWDVRWKMITVENDVALSIKRDYPSREALVEPDKITFLR